MKNSIRKAYDDYCAVLGDYRKRNGRFENRIMALKNKIRWHKKRIDRFKDRKYALKKDSKNTAGLDAQISAAYKKVAEYEAKIHSLKSGKDALSFPYWTDYLLPDVVSALVAATPGIRWELRDHYTTAGLRAVAYIWGDTAEEYTVGVAFTHYEGKLYFDTGETENRFAANTLGAINGMNNITEELHSIDQLTALIARQVRSAAEHCNRLKNENEHS